MKKILIVSSANGVENLGDNAMFEVSANYFKKHGLKVITDGTIGWKTPLAIQVLPFMSKTSRFKVLNLYIAKFRFNLLYFYLFRIKKLGIPYIDPVVNSYMSVIRESKFVFISGAGAINDIFAVHGIYGWGMIILIAKYYNKKIIISGNGIGPIKNKENKNYIKKYINLVDRIFIRDSINSKKELIKLGVHNSKITAAIDDAFFLIPTSEELVMAKRLINKIGIKGDFFVINIHSWNKKYLAELYKYLRKLIYENKQYDVLLLPNYFTGEMDDRKILSEFLYLLKNEKFTNVYLLERKISASVSKAILKHARLSVATRYHIGVFSLSMGTPSILITLDDDYYVQKMKGILRWYKLEKFTLRFKDLSKLHLIFNNLELDYNKYKDLIIAENKKIHRKGLQSGEYVIENF